MPKKKKKIKPVRLGLVQLHGKPKGMSQKEWDKDKEVRERAARAAKRPHIFHDAHRMLAENERKLKETLRKKITIGGD